jgi:hypothetical protein
LYSWVEDAALDIEVVPVFDIHRPAVAQRGNQRLLDYRQIFALRVLDNHRVADGQQALLDGAECVAFQVFKDQRLADAQYFSIHLEDPFALLVFDPEVIADGNEVLAYLVTG